MNPPLATEADRKVLVEGLRAGTIDCVATDHAPHAQAEKALPFTEAPMGTTGLETAFAALYTELVLPGVLELGVLLERMTAGAALFGLPVPTLAQGKEANIALIDLDAEWVAGEHGWQSRSANCCFAGRRLRGRVLLTVAAGAVAYRATWTAPMCERRRKPGGGRMSRARAGCGRTRRAGGRWRMSLLSRKRAALVVVDVQEAFRGYASFDGVASSCAKLVQGARILGLPALVSEQYPKGLGHTAPELGLEEEPRIEKSVFSAARAEGFERSEIGPNGRTQAVVCGIETHVCVSQTVHDLLGQGIEVHVPADAVGSRHTLDYERGLERMERAGAVITTVEAALFELLERAGTIRVQGSTEAIL